MFFFLSNKIRTITHKTNEILPIRELEQYNGLHRVRIFLQFV